MFCPRCGAQQPAFARFCERCGRRLDLDDATTTTVAAAPAPVAGQRPKRDPRLIGGAVAAALVILAVAVLALTGAFGSDDSAERVAAPASTALPPTPTTTAPATTTTQAPATNPGTGTNAEAPAPQPVRATVKRTCGRNGVGGDCHLSVRTRPSTTAAEVKRLDEGDSLRLTCQVRGDSVFSSALGDSSTVWSRTTGGGYVSNAYVVGPRLSARRITLPRC